MHIIIIVLVRVVKNINFSALFVNLNFVFRVSSRDIFRERDFINHPPFLDVHEDVSLVILMLNNTFIIIIIIIVTIRIIREYKKRERKFACS